MNDLRLCVKVEYQSGQADGRLTRLKTSWVGIVVDFSNLEEELNMWLAVAEYYVECRNVKGQSHKITHDFSNKRHNGDTDG